jgi:hypothetical protein
MAGPRRPRSRTLATWLALLGGSLGLHRFYLHGMADRWAWLRGPPALVGAFGVWRMRVYGSEDRLGSVLVLLLGAVIAVAMLEAIVYGLTPSERWNARFGAGAAPGRFAWLAISGAAVALALGATVTMATIAFAAQRYFEWRAPG